ncbi:MAG: hypothetical protein AB1445_11185 [Bacillota bacterium]
MSITFELKYRAAQLHPGIGHRLASYLEDLAGPGYSIQQLATGEEAAILVSSDAGEWFVPLVVREGQDELTAEVLICTPGLQAFNPGRDVRTLSPGDEASVVYYHRLIQEFLDDMGLERLPG